MYKLFQSSVFCQNVGIGIRVHRGNSLILTSYVKISIFGDYCAIWFFGQVLQRGSNAWFKPAKRSIEMNNGGLMLKYSTIILKFQR